jgi:glycosyltransferase involved in cell wall biosynthesis
MDDLADFADVLVLSRTRYDGNVHRLIDSFRQAGKKVYSDVDDLIFSPQHAGLVARSLGHPTEGKVIDSWFAFLSRVNETLRLSDEVIVSTPHLAGLVAKEFDKPIHTVSNFLNNEQLAIADGLEERSADTNNPKIRIGYFSGSNSHKLDFDTMAPSLARLLAANANVDFVIAGHLDLPDVLAPHANRIERLPFMNILELQEAMATVDVNVVPLQHNDFTHSKSELKFFEAAIVGTPTIASAAPVFEAVIDHGKNGLLVHDHDWDAALGKIAELSVEDRERMGQRARETAQRMFTPSSMAHSITQVFSLK